MLLSRKDFLKSVGALAALGATRSGDALAQEYPTQDLHLICGFPAGTGADLFVRFFGEKLKGVAGRVVIVENRAGAGSSIATEYVARSKPDGHVLYPFSATSVAASMHLFKNPPVDVGKALVVAATTSRLAFMLVVDDKSPYRTVGDLTAAMKKKGANATYATSATPGTVMGALYKVGAGLDAVEIVYKNSFDTLNEMASGKLDFSLQDPQFSTAQAREGRLRILAVSSTERLQAMPDIPTMRESGVPMDLNVWTAVMVPSATPKPIVNKINEWFLQIVASDDAKKFLAASGSEPLSWTPERSQEEFLKAIDEWGNFVRLAKIEPT